jgi:hypothetical protein
MTCKAYQINDEMYCPRCDRRWSMDDHSSPLCKRPVRLIGLTGAAGSGKSTVAAMLERTHGFHRMKFASPLKAMLRELLIMLDCPEEELDDHIEGALKEEPCKYLDGRTPRLAMQTLGTEWGRNCMGKNFWVNLAEERVMRVLGCGGRIVFDDVRFMNEAGMIAGLGGKIVRLTGRGGIDGQHASENGFDSHDVTIDNGPDTSVMQLYEEVNRLVS